MGRSSRQRAEERRRREQAAAEQAAAPSPAPPTRLQRLTARFYGIPGASLTIGFCQLLWRAWPYIFRRGEDADFLWDLWIKAGGDFPVLIQAITSPFFGAALIAGGIAYAVFAKEPERSVPPIVPKIGWAIVGLCGLLLGGAFISEQMLRASHIGTYVTDLVSERHLTPAQISQLKERLGPLADKFHHSLDVAAADNPEARGYAIELMIALQLAGLRVNSANSQLPMPIKMEPLNTAVKGVFIQIPHSAQPSEEVTILTQALNDAGIKTSFYGNPMFWNDNYMLTVGLK
jgi:hypothetical protein